MGQEQRSHRRYPVEIACEVGTGEDLIVACTHNVSLGGVGVVVDRKLHDGAEVDVLLFLTQDGIQDPDEEPVEGRATVQWSAEREDRTHQVGLQFTHLSETATQRLKRFLAALAES